VFGLALTFGGGGLLAALATVVTAIASVHHGSPVSDPVTIAGLHFSYPGLNLAEGLLLTLAALGATVLVIAARATWRQRRAYRALMTAVGVPRSLPGHSAVRVVKDSQPQAFCAGYVRPAVYVSERTLDLLAENQLEAVLAHEHHHLRLRDPLRFACTRILGKALFFVPVLRPLSDRYGEVAELRADEAAVRASAGDRAPLASALLIFEANSNPDIAGISPERVDSLLGAAPRWRLPGRLITASLVSLSGLAALIWQASSAASAHATFNLPVLSSQPCVAVLTMLPLVGCLGILRLRQTRHRTA
jgi:hypothetical protein